MLYTHTHTHTIHHLSAPLSIATSCHVQAVTFDRDGKSGSSAVGHASQQQQHQHASSDGGGASGQTGDNQANNTASRSVLSATCRRSYSSPCGTACHACAHQWPSFAQWFTTEKASLILTPGMLFLFQPPPLLVCSAQESEPQMEARNFEDFTKLLQQGGRKDDKPCGTLHATCRMLIQNRFLFWLLVRNQRLGLSGSTSHIISSRQ